LWCLSRRAGGSSCTGNCDDAWERCSCKLTQQKESRIEEGHLMLDHVRMKIAIPPKYAVSQVIGFIKGKRAIHLARVYGKHEEKLCGAAFLGARVLGVNRGPGRSRDSRLHAASGAREARLGGS
jgi:hypothetical protein